jgi:RHS repeat-associated protein
MTRTATAFTAERQRRFRLWHQLREKSRTRPLRRRRIVILPGQYYDVETGFNYNNFRDYDPATGRYLESDPVGLSAGIGTYSDVAENPLSSTDPEGLEAAPPFHSIETWSGFSQPGGPPEFICQKVKTYMCKLIAECDVNRVEPGSLH